MNNHSRITGLGLIIFTVIALFCSRPVSAVNYFVVDRTDNSPIAGATAINSSGIIIGRTDGNGRIAVKPSELPLTIRCIGFEPLLTSEQGDTLRMAPVAYELREFVVRPKERPVKRVICFAREYTTGIIGRDTLQYYCEYMAEAFLVDEKTKGYKKTDARPQAKSIKRYARVVENGRDSVFIPTDDDAITAFSWFSLIAFLPEKKVEMPQEMRDGARTAVVQGKYAPKFLYSRKNGLFTKTTNEMSDHEGSWSPLIFKLIGFTIDIDSGSWTMSFTDDGSGNFDIYNYHSGAVDLHLTARGKWIKRMFKTNDTIEMSSYTEIFPVGITHHTVAEYKEMRRDKSPLPFVYPSDIQPLAPTVQKLIDYESRLTE